jgi:hypothetical protein
MVDLTITPCPGQSLPKDVYFALRIADTQKLGRMSTERLYRFPQSAVGFHQYGKVEVLKKIAGYTIGVNPDKDTCQDLKINFEGNTWKFFVNLKPPAGKAVGNPEPKSKKDERPRVLAAKKYLEDHNLEMRLKDAMQEVIKVMPADPAAFIGKHLRENAKYVTESFVPGQCSSEGKDDELRLKAKQILFAGVEDGRLQSELQSLKAKSKTDPSTEDLRRQARDTLLTATSSGRLESALANIRTCTSLPTGTEFALEELRQEAKGKILEAVASGSLDDALARLKHTELSGLRQQTKQLISEATTSGRLDNALADLKKSKSSPAFSPADTDSLRRQAKQSLIDAAAGGQLSKALASIDPVSGDSLRQQAKDTLLAASSSGRLEAALANVKEPIAESDLAELRQQAKQKLLEAAGSGQLGDALATIKQSQVSSDAELRQQAKQLLSEATSSGRLSDALANLKKSKSAQSSTEQLRIQARTALLAATQSGNLQSILAHVKSERSLAEAAPTEELRLQAKRVLFDAVSSGSLDKALQEVQSFFSEVDLNHNGQISPKEFDQALSSGLLTCSEEVKTDDSVDIATLRSWAKNSLVDAAASGRLGQIIVEVKQVGGETDLEQLRKKVQSHLISTLQRGKLHQAFIDASGDLKLQVAVSLLKGAASGQLARTLAAPVSEGMASDTETLRQKAMTTLMKATATGEVNTAFAAVRQADTANYALRTQVPELIETSTKLEFFEARWKAAEDKATATQEELARVRDEFAKTKEDLANLAKTVAGLEALVGKSGKAL